MPPALHRASGIRLCLVQIRAKLGLLLLAPWERVRLTFVAGPVVRLATPYWKYTCALLYSSSFWPYARPPPGLPLFMSTTPPTWVAPSTTSPRALRSIPPATPTSSAPPPPPTFPSPRSEEHT